MQRRSSCGYFDKGIDLQKIGPNRWNLSQMTERIVKKQITFGIDALVLNNVELFATKRMKRVRDPHFATLIRPIGRSRGAIATNGRWSVRSKVGRAPIHTVRRSPCACRSLRVQDTPWSLVPVRTSLGLLQCHDQFVQSSRVKAGPYSDPASPGQHDLQVGLCRL